MISLRPSGLTGSPSAAGTGLHAIACSGLLWIAVGFLHWIASIGLLALDSSFWVTATELPVSSSN